MSALVLALLLAAEPPFPAFADATREAGLSAFVLRAGGARKAHIPEAMAGGVAWLDFDLDGDWDLLLAGGGDGVPPRAGSRSATGRDPWLLRNLLVETGRATFVDATKDCGLAGAGAHGWGMGVTAADHDGDGDTDLYLTLLGSNRLYRNDLVRDGKRGERAVFTDVSEAAGVDVATWSTGAAFADVDGDRDLDLFVAGYVDFDPAFVPANRQFTQWRGIEVFPGPVGLAGAPDRLFRNLLVETGRATFRDVSSEAGVGDPDRAYGFAALFLDADGDGDQDLYVANDSRANFLHVNDGRGRFVDRGFLAGVAYGEDGTMQAGMGAAAGDCDTDGRLDLVVTNFSYDHDTLYRNAGGLRFEDVSWASGLGRPTHAPLAFGVTWLDADLDGDEDLFIANGHIYPQVDARDFGTTYAQRNLLFENRTAPGGPCRLADASARAGAGLAVSAVSRGAAAADHDGDGDLDLVVVNLDGAPTLLRNDAPKGAWIAVRCEGRPPNRAGIGARVAVSAGGRTQVREIRTSAGYLSCEPPVAFFGLGAATAADVVVRFPGGRTATRTAVAAGQSITVKE